MGELDIRGEIFPVARIASPSQSAALPP